MIKWVFNQIGGVDPTLPKLANLMRQEEVCRNTIIFAFTQSHLGSMIGLTPHRPNHYAGLLANVLRDYTRSGELNDAEDIRFDPVFRNPEEGWK